jgi:hypothetical protein
LTDVGARRIIPSVVRSVAVIIATIVALWVPLRHTGVAPRDALASHAGQNTETGCPSTTSTLGPALAAGVARTWVTGHFHVLKPVSQLPSTGSAGEVSRPAARLRVPGRTIHRTFPLLI